MTDVAPATRGDAVNERAPLSLDAAPASAPPQAAPPWGIEMLRGARALEAVRDPGLRRDWQALVDAASHMAAFQAPGFVGAWYETYAGGHEPLLCLGRAAGGAVVGVLPLALAAPGTPPVFAGAHQCEYAGWLSTPALGQDFPALAVARLHDAGLFRTPWDWRWLAPGLGTGWLRHPALRARGVRAVTRADSTPVLALQDPNRPRFFEAGGKNEKRKLGRLRRLGPVELVRVAPDALTPDLLDRLATTYDVRTLARYGSAPFTDDPLKGPFHRRMLEASGDTARLYALRAGRETVAFYFVIVDRRRATYCLAAFDHRLVDASPGKLLADLVADDLAAHGLEYLDHSPGGDPYKREAASHDEPLTRLALFPEPTRWLSHKALALARATVGRALRAMAVSAERQRGAARLVQAAAQRPLPELAAIAGRALRKRVWSREVMLLFRLEREEWRPADADGPASGPLFRDDRVDDFIFYTGSNRWRSRQALMLDSLERLQAGDHCATVVQDGVLVHYGWITPHAPAIHLSEVDHRVALPGGGGVAYDSYTEPTARGLGLHQQSLAHRIGQCFRLGAASVTTAVRESNLVSLRNNERLLGRPVARVVRVRRLGLTWSWEEPLSP